MRRTLCLLVLWLAAPATADVPYAWTGKVAIEGAITANHDAPRAGDVFLVYVNATLLRASEGMVIRLLRPQEAETLDGAPLEASWRHVAAGDTHSFVVPLRATGDGELELRAHVALLDAEGAEGAARSFVLILNPAPHGRPPREGRSGDGEPLLIYPGD